MISLPLLFNGGMISLAEKTDKKKTTIPMDIE